jgi:hypothetical protein
MGLFKIIGTIFFIFFIIAIGLIVYFYYFYTFKTLKICISNEFQETNISCENNEFCINQLTKENSLFNNSEEFPDFFKNKLLELNNKIIFCQNTCKIKSFYGNYFNNSEFVRCKQGEEEVKLKINGKKALQMISVVKQEITQ